MERSLGHPRRPELYTKLLLLGMLVLALFAMPIAVSAQESPPETGDQINDYCLGCHDTGQNLIPLPSGEILNAIVPRTVFERSIHGQVGLTCIACHADIGAYPHRPFEAVSIRDATVRLYTACLRCHDEQYNETLDNVHAQALAGGNQEAAVCTDCHGAHEITLVEDDQAAIVATCRHCHSEIYDLYAGSIHGAALLDENNTDVPTCTDCHGVHSVHGPSESQFHLFSPQLCADCHADEELMAKYDLPAGVFDTYVADFHGTTVMVFEEIDPEHAPNTAVCTDCHGVHNIQPADEVESTVFKENLLVTCQRCHPDATSDFPDSWLRHYDPDTENAVLVWLVDWFYRLIIPGVVGGMLIWVSVDFIRSRQLGRLSHG